MYSYGLNLTCPQGHTLNASFLASDASLEISEFFGRWGLHGSRRSLEAAL